MGSRLEYGRGFGAVRKHQFGDHGAELQRDLQVRLDRRPPRGLDAKVKDSRGGVDELIERVGRYIPR